VWVIAAEPILRLINPLGIVPPEGLSPRAQGGIDPNLGKSLTAAGKSSPSKTEARKTSAIAAC